MGRQPHGVVCCSARLWAPQNLQTRDQSNVMCCSRVRPDKVARFVACACLKTTSCFPHHWTKTLQGWQQNCRRCPGHWGVNKGATPPPGRGLRSSACWQEARAESVQHGDRWNRETWAGQLLTDRLLLRQLRKTVTSPVFPTPAGPGSVRDITLSTLSGRAPAPASSLLGAAGALQPEEAVPPRPRASQVADALSSPSRPTYGSSSRPRLFS